MNNEAVILIGKWLFRCESTLFCNQLADAVNILQFNSGTTATTVIVVFEI